MGNGKRQFTWLSSAEHVSSLSIATLCALIAVFNTPILARNMPNVILIGLMLVFVVSVSPLIVKMGHYDLVTLGLLAAYMVILTAYKVLGISTAELYYFFNTVQYYFFFGAMLLIYRLLSPKQRKLLLAVAVGTTMITMVSNVYLWATAPNANTYIDYYKTQRYTTNSVNTQFSTAIMILTGAAFIGGMRQKKWQAKVMLFALSAGSILFAAVITQRLIVVILSGFMFLLFALTYKRPNRWSELSLKKKVIIVAAVAAVALLAVNYKPVLTLVSDMIGSPRVTKRINQIIVFLETGDISAAGGSLAVRFELMMTSFQTFTASWSNFLLGVGDQRATNELIGNHSLILDELARYGVVFATLSFWLVLRSLRAVCRMGQVRSNTRTARYMVVLFAVIILRSLVGALFDASVGIVLFVAAPLLIYQEAELTETIE